MKAIPPRVKSPTGWVTITGSDRTDVKIVRDDGGRAMWVPKWCVRKWLKEVPQEDHSTA